MRCVLAGLVVSAALVAIQPSVAADSGGLCIAADLFPCDAPQALALDRLLDTASISELSDLSTLVLLQDEPHLVAGRAGMVGRALSRSGRAAAARSFLSDARTRVFFRTDWVANAAGLAILARYRKSLGDQAAKDTLVSTAIDWPSGFSVTDRVLYLRELGYGLAQIGEFEAAREEFERARREAAAAPDSPTRQADDGLYALVQLWDYTRAIDGFSDYAAALEAEIVEALSSRSGNRDFWPKSIKDLERR